MKQIKTLTNSFLLQETDQNGKVISELGFKKGGCSYLIKNNNIKFYLKEDYFYKNVIWSANIPLVVNGISYNIDVLPNALKGIFIREMEEIEVDQELDSGSTNAISNHAVTVAINTLSDEVNDRYTKAETDSLLDEKLDVSAYTPVDLNDYYTKEETNAQISSATNDMATQTWVNNQGFLTEHQSLSAYSTTEEMNEAINASTSGKVDNDTYTAYTASTNAALSGKADTTAVTQEISAAVSGKADATAVTQEISAAVSGKADTTAVTAINDTLTAHTADTTIHVTSSDKETWNAKADISDIPSVSGYADSVKYNSTSKYVEFYHGGTGGTKVFEYDASPFLIDGMVQNVEIKDVTLSGETVTCLVISFNTDAGKQDINIPLTEIFDPSNYYTKTETDNAISSATNDMATKTWVGQQGYLTEHQDISGKQDVSGMTAYTTTAVTDALNTVVTSHTANTTIHVTTSEKNTWNAKSDFSGSYNDLTDKPTIPTVPTDVSAFNNDAGYITSDGLSGYATEQWVGEQGYLTEHQSLSAYSTTEEVNTAIEEATSGKADTSAVTAVNNVLTAHTADTTIHVTSADKTAWNAKSDFSGSYNDLTDKPTIPTVPTNVSEFNNDAGYATSGYVDASISGKADSSDVQSLSGTVTAHTANTVIHVTSSQTAAWNAKSDFSGSYNDLTDKPTIPTVSTAITSGDTNAVAGGAVYDKVTYNKEITLEFDNNGKSTNLPNGCTSITVELELYQTSTLRFYNASDTQLGSYNILNFPQMGGLDVRNSFDDSTYTTSGNVVTITWPSSKGVAYLIKAGDGVIKTIVIGAWLKDAVSGNTVAIEGKQDTLVSGTNIKTINNQSLLGSGNITIEGGGSGSSTVELTQAEYDALVSAGTVASDTYYIITDATPIETSGFVQTSAITSAVTSASTDSEIPTAKAVFDAIPTGGTSITIDPTLDSGSTNPVANSAITTAINDKANKVLAFGSYSFGQTNNVDWLQFKNVSNTNIGSEIYYPKINNKAILTNNGTWARNNYDFSLVETSAVTSSMTSSSTDSQVPSAKCVYDQLGGLKLVKISQTDYDNLSTKDNNTLYIIT